MSKFLFLFLLPLQIFSQSNLLSEKYFSYRTRLVNVFMLGVGKDFGMSMPASMRNTHDSIYSGRETIKWGDATIDLSYYIATLAMEYKLLTDEVKQQQTLTELFYALEAFNRVDYYAEEYFNAAPLLNGFFVRSDVGRNLFDVNSKNAQYKNAVERLNNNAQPINNITSEWLNYHLKKDTRRFAMSKDQTFHILLAMMFVVKCIPAHVNYANEKFLDGETSINTEAKKITDRIMSYIHNPADGNIIYKWRVKKPNGKKVNAGYNAWSFAYGMSLAQKKISGAVNPQKRGVNWWLAKAVYNTTWSLFRPIYFFNNGEGVKTLSLVCINNSCKGNAEKVYRYSYLFKEYPSIHIPLVFAFFNGRLSKNINLKDYEKLFAEAPQQGPFNDHDRTDRIYNWSSTSLTLHPQRRGSNRPNFPGKYNGIDYMFLYNLYLLNSGKTY